MSAGGFGKSVSACKGYRAKRHKVLTHTSWTLERGVSRRLMHCVLSKEKSVHYRNLHV
jgi:hypothetical protein